MQVGVGSYVFSDRRNMQKTWLSVGRLLTVRVVGHYLNVQYGRLP